MKGYGRRRTAQRPTDAQCRTDLVETPQEQGGIRGAVPAPGRRLGQRVRL